MEVRLVGDPAVRDEVNTDATEAEHLEVQRVSASRDIRLPQRRTGRCSSRESAPEAPRGDLTLAVPRPSRERLRRQTRGRWRSRDRLGRRSHGQQGPAARLNAHPAFRHRCISSRLSTCRRAEKTDNRVDNGWRTRGRRIGHQEHSTVGLHCPGVPKSVSPS